MNRTFMMFGVRGCVAVSMALLSTASNAVAQVAPSASATPRQAVAAFIAERQASDAQLRGHHILLDTRPVQTTFDTQLRTSRTPVTSSATPTEHEAAAQALNTRVARESEHLRCVANTRSQRCEFPVTNLALARIGDPVVRGDSATVVYQTTVISGTDPVKTVPWTNQYVAWLVRDQSVWRVVRVREATHNVLGSIVFP